MIGTQTRPDTMTRPAPAQQPAAGGGGRPRRRPDGRLWSLLRASALLGGSPGGPYDPAVIEDDRRRLAGRQAR